MKRVIAVVEDEPDIIDLVCLHLKEAGFECLGFSCAEGLLKYLENSLPDLVILDLMLPDMDGLDVCRFMKGSERLKKIPIIMLTARDTETDRVLGLELGADDYVTKPFSPRELVARVKAVLRRVDNHGKSAGVKVGDLEIDEEKFEVYAANRRVDLTVAEFRLLSTLAKRLGKVFSREALIREIWGNDKAVTERSVDVHIKKLRDKLGECGSYIKTVRGVGYKLEP